jgi:hypothetical protein
MVTLADFVGDGLPSKNLIKDDRENARAAEEAKRSAALRQYVGPLMDEAQDVPPTPYKTSGYEKSAGIWGPLAGIIESIATKGKGNVAQTHQQMVEAGTSARSKRSETEQMAYAANKPQELHDAYIKSIAAIEESNLPDSEKERYKDIALRMYDPKTHAATTKTINPTESMRLAADWAAYKKGEMSVLDFAALHTETHKVLLLQDPAYAKSFNESLRSQAASRSIGGVEGKTAPEVTQLIIDQKNAEEELTRPGKVETASQTATAQAAGSEAGKKQGGIILPPSELETAASMQNSIASLSQLKGKFNEDWAIPFLGQPISSIFSKFNDKRADFEVTKQRFENELLKARSGAAVTPAEYTRLLKETGDLSVTPSVWQARLQNNIEYLNRALEQKKNTLRKSGYDVSGFEATPAPAASVAPGADKFVVGKIYPDPDGNKAKYMGNGEWQEVK